MNTESSIHCFSRVIAREHGVTEAILLGYIGNRIDHSQQERNGRKWFYESLDGLAQRYPYLARTTIDSALKRLAGNNGPLLIDNHNRHAYDRTRWYAWRNDDTKRQLQAEPVYFRVCDAEVYGVCEAVLLANLRYWIGKHRETNPDYCWHPLSPAALAKVLPFSESGIKRALQHLADDDTRVLLVRRPNDRRHANEYALVDNQTCSDLTGPDRNVTHPYSNMAGPNRDMTGSDRNTGGPNRDMGGPDRDNDTYLKEDCLKDSVWKESLKDKSFQSACVTGAFDSPGGSNQNVLQMNYSAVNAFVEPIVGTINQPPALTHAISISAPNALVAVSLAPPNKPEYSPTRQASMAYLDSQIHSDLMTINDKLSLNHDEADEHVLTAQAAVTAIKDMIKVTAPNQLHRFVACPNQRDCMAEIERYTDGYFEQVYNNIYVRADYADNERLCNQFVRYAKGLMAMAAHSYRFESYRIYNGHSFAYQVTLSMFCVVSPWLEKQQAERQSSEIAQRRQQYASQDAAKECRTDLSAAEKMQVFMQSVMSRNRVGQYNERGKFVQQVVMVNAQTMPLVRQFFQLNPQMSVQHLNTVLDRCLELPTEYYDSEADQLWHARNARNLSLFVRHLHVVVAQLGLLDALPPFVPVPPPDEANEESDKL